MRLHLLCSAILFAAASVCSADESNSAKALEATPGQGTPVRAAKESTRFSTQVQLFIEQKEAPVASKTSLGLKGSPRVSQKSKD